MEKGQDWVTSFEESRWNLEREGYIWYATYVSGPSANAAKTAA